MLKFIVTFDIDYTYSTVETTAGGQSQTYAYTYSTTYPTYPITTDYPVGGGGAGGGGGKYLIKQSLSRLRISDRHVIKPKVKCPQEDYIFSCRWRRRRRRYWWAAVT